jgi:predicted lipoprotein
MLAKRWSVNALMIAAILFVAACGGGGNGDGGVPNGPTPPPAEFDRNALLRTYADRIVLPALREFAVAAADLAAATATLEAAVTPGSAADAEWAAARDAWRIAIGSWQFVEVLQIGPAGSPGMTMGGRGLRDEIYSWPTVNPCRVDQETGTGDFTSDDFFVRELVNTRGLAAIEYLLFDPDDNNACAAAVDINANGTWAALMSAGEVPVRRAAYAARAAAEVSARAVELRDDWEPAGGNFAGQVSNAGSGDSIYESAQEAIDAVFAALFYVELRVKDRKLAVPAGLDPECSSSTCPEQQESRWADASREHLMANLVISERVFLGHAAGVGFDDFLRARGADDLADEMIADLEQAIAAAEAIPGTLTNALASDPDSVRAAHAALKVFTDNLKSQFITVLNLTIPREGAGDND